MDIVGVPASLFEILLTYTFVRKALECAARLTRLGSPFAGGREENRFIGYIGVLAGRASARSVPATTLTPADVTIAIATMNRPLALRRCADAIFRSTPLPGELVIVDQSGNSLTAALVAESGWHNRVPIRYIRQPREGLAASRNVALRHASRPVVAFTDDDCVPEEGWLAALVTGFNGAERPDAVTGRVLPLGPERPDFYPVSLRESTTAALYSMPTLPWSVGSGGNVAVKRGWLERIGGFDERLGAGSPGLSAEDMDLFHRLLRAGATVRYNPAAVVYHERQDFRRRLASRPAYGFGMGTFCALSARQRDLYAAWILTRWCGDRLRALAASCVRLQRRRIREEYLMLHGAVRGLGHGLTLTSR